MNRCIRRAAPGDMPAVSNLVQAGFTSHIAPGWEPSAHQHFLDETAAEKLEAKLAETCFAAVCEAEAQILGFVWLPRPNLVQLLFVAPDHLRQGIGAVLWEAARAHVEERFPDTKTIELNASPHALRVYEALGFFPISMSVRRAGTVTTRMACWLPGRALAEAHSGA